MSHWHRLSTYNNKVTCDPNVTPRGLQGSVPFHIPACTYDCNHLLQHRFFSPAVIGNLLILVIWAADISFALQGAVTRWWLCSTHWTKRKERKRRSRKVKKSCSLTLTPAIGAAEAVASGYVSPAVVLVPAKAGVFCYLFWPPQLYCLPAVVSMPHVSLISQLRLEDFAYLSPADKQSYSVRLVVTVFISRSSCCSVIVFVAARAVVFCYF